MTTLFWSREVWLKVKPACLNSGMLGNGCYCINKWNRKPLIVKGRTLSQNVISETRRWKLGVVYQLKKLWGVFWLHFSPKTTYTKSTERSKKYHWMLKQEPFISHNNTEFPCFSFNLTQVIWTARACCGVVEFNKSELVIFPINKKRTTPKKQVHKERERNLVNHLVEQE